LPHGTSLLPVFSIQRVYPSSTTPPLHHTELWTILQPGLTNNSSYNYAQCCTTFYDRRKKLKDKEDLDHTNPVTLYEVLGKRRFNSEREFSSTISKLEKTLEDPLSQVGYNRDHTLTQHSIQLSRLEKKFKSLEERVHFLEEDNVNIKAELESEKKHKAVLLQIFKNIVNGDGKVCALCKTQLLDTLSLPN